MVDSQLLARLPLFASVDEAGLHQIAAWFEQRDVSAGVDLTGEGAPGYSFFVLAEGAAAVVSGDTTLARLGPGDFFGEGAMVGDGRRHATVTATAPSQVLVMFGTEFRRLQQLHPAVAATIDEVAAERAAASGAP